MLVADTGPLIAFSRIRLLDTLKAVVGELAIPPAVRRELVDAGLGRPGADLIEGAAWIKVYPLVHPLLAPGLHEGEQEAIALAQELGIPLLIDEQRGRGAARRRRVEIIGTLGILAMAKRQGALAEVKPAVEALVFSGYWISSELARNFLRLVGERAEPQ